MQPVAFREHVANGLLASHRHQRLKAGYLAGGRLVILAAVQAPAQAARLVGSVLAEAGCASVPVGFCRRRSPGTRSKLIMAADARSSSWFA